MQLIVYWEKTERSLVLALRSLWLHKLRAFLSVLGIIFGTAAVISLMAFGEGSMRDALDDIERQGAKNIIIRSVKPPDDANSQRRSFMLTYGLTEADHERFRMISSVVKSVPMRIIFPQEVRRLQYMQVGRVVGTTQEYQSVNKIDLTLGRFLVDADERTDQGDDTNMRNVCVLGSEIADGLFPFESPLGKTVVLNKYNYVVVGVLADRMPTGNLGGSTASAEDFNNDVYIPLNTCRARYGEKIFLRQSGSRSGEAVELHQVTLEISDRNQVVTAGAAIRDLLESTHQKKDWAVTIPLDRLEHAEKERDRFTILLAFIGGISLLVGGIGIMNIMLASVTERTREIGIRRALGAKRRDITFQFLIEAIAQTSVGGLLGLALGLSIIYLIPPFLEHFFDLKVPAKLHVPAIFMGLSVAVSVGVLFGWYPAQRASRLDPIEALRHE
jgi:putative ABC transport system permease protein